MTSTISARESRAWQRGAVCWQASVKGQGREVHNMLVATTGQAGRACRLLCPMPPPVVIAARAGSGGRACRAAAPAGRQRCAGARRTRACVRACMRARPQVLPARCAVRGAHAQLYRCAFVQLRIWQQTGLTKMGRGLPTPPQSCTCHEHLRHDARACEQVAARGGRVQGGQTGKRVTEKQRGRRSAQVAQPPDWVSQGCNTRLCGRAQGQVGAGASGHTGGWAHKGVGSQ